MAFQEKGSTPRLEGDAQYRTQSPDLEGTRGRSRSFTFHLRTLFLFTKSDFKTTTIPQSIFAISALFAPSAAKCVASFDFDEPPNAKYLAKQIPLMVFWLWLNCLAHNIANQSLPDSVVEDSLNKPWRPIPSGRITAAQARSWLLWIITASLVTSFQLGALQPMTMLMVLVWMYNDLDGSSGNVWLRNALNSGGLMCFGWGALSVLAGGQEQLLPKAYTWLLLTGAVVLTTVHSQDLPDIDGDRARGRGTVPLVYGETIARWSVAINVLVWSVAGPYFWVTSTTTLWLWVAPLGLGGALGTLALARMGQAWDEVVLQLWCLWSLVLYLSPVMASLRAT